MEFGENMGGKEFFTEGQCIEFPFKNCASKLQVACAAWPGVWGEERKTSDYIIFISLC